MKVERTIIIYRSPQSVFDFVSTMNNYPLWAPVKSVQQTSEGPAGVGTTYNQEGEIMGQQYEATSEITEYQPPATFAFKVASGSLNFISKFRFEPLENGIATKVTLVGEGDLGSALRFAGPLLNTVVKKQLDDQLGRLKKVLEAR
ncbi:MAG: SRPBCC family protein [Ktedonobacteraceae bacterium]|nr:SRPBCC family protein [Ktedonobacteraceae bacterium]